MTMLSHILPVNSQHCNLPMNSDFDPMPVCDADAFNEADQAAGLTYARLMARKRLSDLIEAVPTPLNANVRATKRRLGRTSNVFTEPIYNYPNIKSSASVEHTQTLASSSAEAEANAALFTPHRISSKRRPPGWWHHEGELKYTELGTQQWTLSRKAIDMYQSWCLQRLYSDPDVVELVPYNQKRNIAQEEWKKLTHGERCYWKVFAASGRSLFPLPMNSGIDSMQPLPVGVTKTAIMEGYRTCGMLLTWHGDWGMNDAAVEAAVAACETAEHLAKVLAGMHIFKELGDSYFKFCSSVAILLGFSQVSVSVEHCQNGVVAARVHLHCYMSGGRHRLTHVTFDLLEFQNVRVGHVAFTGYGTKGDNAVIENQASSKKVKFNSGRANEAHYYLQFEKIGSLFQLTNFHKFTDFAVPCRWIMNQYKLRKMTADVAYGEIICCRDRCKGSITELEFQMGKQVELINERREKAAKASMKRSMRPFVMMPAAVAEWLAQYDRPDEHQLFRYKPLVLDGPTRFGKTTWAMSFFGPEQTLQVNCQNITSPNLLAWKRQCDIYKAILFDEGSWQLIFENKMLFQAGPCSIDLGQSATNCNAYKVFVYGTPMIICSNEFWADINDAGRNYLEHNIIYVQVSTPCYT